MANLTAFSSIHTAAGWPSWTDLRNGGTTADLIHCLSREVWTDGDNAEPCQGDCADAERGRRCRCASVDTGIQISIRPRVVKAVKPRPSDDLFADDDLEALPF